MSKKTIQEFLGKGKGRTAVLRSPRGGVSLRDNQESLVAVRCSERAKIDLRGCYGPPLVEVRRQYVERFFYRWGRVELWSCFEFKGWEYLEDSRFWSLVRDGDDGVPRPCLAHDAFIVWVCGLLNGACFDDGEADLIKDSIEKEEPEILHCLQWAFGRAWAGQLLELGRKGLPADARVESKALLSALKWQSVLRQGLGCIGPVISHWLREARLYVRPPFPWIAFLGPDGSGKSTVIDGVKDFFEPIRLQFLHVHWRPTIRKPLEHIGPPATDPHHNKSRGLVLSLVALFSLMGRWWIGYGMRMWHRRVKREVILSDRYYRDLLVDQKRYVYGGPVWLARRLFGFLPRPDLTLFLLADAETIHSRKAEVTLEELERQLKAYRALAESLGESAAVIDVGPAREVVIETVVGEICRRFESRNSE